MTAPEPPAEGVAAVIVAAGRGARAGQDNGPKQYRRIGGRAVLSHTLEAFRRHPAIGDIAIAIHADDAALYRDAVPDADERILVVTGGPTRQESTLFALRAMAAEGGG